MNDRAKRLYEIRVGLRQALESFEILKIERLGKRLRFACLARSFQLNPYESGGVCVPPI